MNGPVRPSKATESTTWHQEATLGQKAAETAVHGLSVPSYALAILRGLQSKPVYQGTVPPAVKARRRAANKVARLSRKQNRS